MNNQCNEILNYMKSHGSITDLEAYKMGCRRLAARIYDLRCSGHEIETTRFTTRNGARPARYRLK